MPAYTIQQDQPWISNRASQARSATSMYSDDYDALGQENIAPLKMQGSHDPSYHAHPQQQIKDHGPQVRQSRLPIFKQVRSMLHRPPRLTTPSSPKWDEYTGELSESGKPSKVQPSTYVPPHDDSFEESTKLSTDRTKKTRKDQSPVSVLKDEELTPVEPVNEENRIPATRSPVSPVSSASQGDDHFEDAVDRSLLPEPLSPNVQRNSQQTSPGLHVIKRKPLSISASSTEDYPPISPQHSPSQSTDMNAVMDDEKVGDTENQPRSHFSWTTYAPTVAPQRHSIDTMATRNIAEDLEEPNSRFSWSTVATHPAPPESPPSSPPSFPAKFSSPPMQSILSRRRPVQRVEKTEWVPPPPRARSGDAPLSAISNSSSTPNSASTARAFPLAKSGTPTSGSPSTTSKALPPPPQLISTHNLTHLETLLAQERDIILQRTNVERGIRDMEKIEKASPMDVSFAVVRDAKKRLAEYRTRLAEVQLEERDIGVAIARARRKEEKETGGDGETLWVRKFSR